MLGTSISVELARERHAAAPEDGPVRRHRRPFDRAGVWQQGGVLRLQHAELPARQVDRPADELFEHEHIIVGDAYQRPASDGIVADVAKRRKAGWRGDVRAPDASLEAGRVGGPR